MQVLLLVNVLMLIVVFCLNNFMNIKVVIPCHLNSIRLEQKILIDIQGLPMVEHVRRRALLSQKVENVIIATGDIKIKNIVESYGGEVLFTKEIHKNGTSRAAEAILNIDCTHVLLIQGDEPLLIPNYLDIFIDNMKNSKEHLMWNAISKIDSKQAYNDNSIVKCLINSKSEIISCFRKSPLSRIDSNYNDLIYKIQGLIAYEKQFLINLVKKKNTLYSKLESIEQMKAIETGGSIKSILLPSSLPSVNTKSELAKVREILSKDEVQQNIFNKINYSNY